MKYCPKSASLQLQAGILWALDGVYDRAATNFSAAEQLAPGWNVPYVNYNLALAYYRTARYTEAEQNASNLLSIEPRAETYNLLGEIQGKLRQYTQAMLSFEKATTLDPQNENYRVIMRVRSSNTVTCKAQLHCGSPHAAIFRAPGACTLVWFATITSAGGTYAAMRL
jgi:tetratricopeptide (TPR) repeat protein